MIIFALHLEHLENGAYARFGDATTLGDVRTLAPGQAYSEPPSMAFGASIQKRAGSRAKYTEIMNIDALRGGVAPKSHASVRTACFIPEAPCLGDWPVASFRWSRVRWSRLAEALYLKNAKRLISERGESRGLSKTCALAHPSFLPGKCRTGHDLFACQ